MHNHVDIDNIGAFGMSFGGSVALYLNQVSDLIKAARPGRFLLQLCLGKTIAKPILLLQNDGPFGHLLTFLF
jgi:dienelactone hydrolase